MATGKLQKRELGDNMSPAETKTSSTIFIRDLLKVKEKDIWSISPDASVFEALELMAEKEVGALVVLEGDKAVGVISERDYARKVILIGKASKETSVREIMSSPVRFVTPDHTVAECMAIMTNQHIRHLPVLVGKRLDGIVSIGDLVKSIISEQGHLIQQLENYILGVYPT